MPQISFRMAFAFTAMIAVLFALARAAESGTAFAIALLVMVGFLLLLFGIFAVVFLAGWLMSMLITGGKVNDSHQGSPFAADQLPPQQLPPRDPTT